jgi:aminoglycoside phosphotransferase (APT) family kinase protein
MRQQAGGFHAVHDSAGTGGFNPVSMAEAAPADVATLDAALLRMGLLAAGERPRYTALTGGVASDIWKVETRIRTFAIKRALPKLKVADEWYVPVARNAYEVKWMEVVRAILPDAVPPLLGHDPQAGLFAMAYLDPAQYRNWKSELRDGHTDESFAAAVGRALARIHCANARRADIAAAFATDEVFHAIRLAAYLEATAPKHPSVADRLMALSRKTLATKLTLVHGDVSPKNILVGPRGPVFLDAECAWYGDPAFDLAFCLNHMLLKCLWTPRAAAGFLKLFDVLTHEYLAGVTWEPPAEMDRRTAHLLPGLFLARVDGKSPAEYVTAESDKARIRRVALHFLEQRPERLTDIRHTWAREMGVKEPA